MEEIEAAKPVLSIQTPNKISFEIWESKEYELSLDKDIYSLNKNLCSNEKIIF